MGLGPGFVHTREATQMQKRRENKKNKYFSTYYRVIIQEITNWSENLAGVAQAPAPSDKSKHKSMNASGKKGDESKVRRKQTTREEAKEDKNLVKMLIIERIATERNEGQQENLQKF